MTGKHKVVYVTSSPYKVEENKIFCDHAQLSDGTSVSDLFEFDIRQVQIKEILEVDLRIMVQAEVTDAYSQIRVPCIVEHAGLVFDEYHKDSYPGGLTKPMWNTLREDFVKETGSSGRRALARAVIAYCDGKSVLTFVGETRGSLTESPRGRREFYWDTVFIPEDPSGQANGMTYAEIIDDPSLGLRYKVIELSQSSRAMMSLLEHLRLSGTPEMWK